MFGCAWKINFPENIFNWPCVLMALTQKLVLVKIFTSNHFRTHAQKERERAQITPSTSPANQSPDHAFDFANLRIDLWTHKPIFDPKPSTHRSTNPRTNLRTHEPIFDPKPSTQSLRPTSLQIRRQPRAFTPQTHELISLSLSLSFWFFVWFWSTHEPIYVSVWFWFFTFSLWSLIFLLLLWWCGWWCFGGFPIVRWWVLCGWWWKIAFSECYQTHENIF